MLNFESYSKAIESIVSMKVLEVLRTSYEGGDLKKISADFLDI
jgi:hypothetical protein